MGAVPAITIRAILEGMRVVGLDTERIVHRSGLRDFHLADADGRIPDSVYVTMWREVRKDAKGAAMGTAIGAAVGAAVPVGMFGPIDYLASTASTLGESIVCIREFGHLTTESSYWEIENGPAGELAATFVNIEIGEEDEVGDEFVMGLLLGRGVELTCQPVHLLEVQLTRRKPSSQLTERFLGRVSYGHARSQLVLGPGAAGVALRRADPRLHATLRALLLEAGKGPARRPGTGMAASAQTCVREMLSEGVSPPTLALVSRRLGLSGRTLQRKLMTEGTSFEHTLDNVRREAALRRLRAPKGPSILELALELGFADERALARAFRRWTGLSPRQWRTEAGSGRDGGRSRSACG